MAELNINKACIESIPNYNGDPATLSIFIAASEQFLLTFRDEQNAQNNAWLLRIIISKLQGRALTLIGSREEATSWNAIKQLLIAYFGDQRNIKCLVRDLMNVKMERNETPYMLGMRIQDIRSLILTKLRLEEPNEAIRLIKQQMYDEIALDAYINALPEKLSDKIRFRNPNELEQAMNLVVEEENVNYYRERSHGLGSNHNFKLTSRLQPFGPPTPPRHHFNNVTPNKFQFPKPQMFNRPQMNWNQSNSNRFNNYNQWRNKSNFNFNNNFNNNHRFQPRPQNFGNQSHRMQQQQQQQQVRTQYYPEPMDTSSGNSRNSGMQRKTNFFKSNNQKPNFISQELFYHGMPEETTFEGINKQENQHGISKQGYYYSNEKSSENVNFQEVSSNPETM